MSTVHELMPPRLRVASMQRARLVAFVQEHLLPLVVFSLLAVLLTWPLVLHFSVAAPTEPGESAQDLWEKLWNLWWFSEALRRRVNPFFTDMLFYPMGASLLYHPLNPANAVLGLPAYAVAGPIASYNTVVLLSFVLSGYSLFLLARRIGCGYVAALIGGLVYSGSSFHRFHLHLNHLELISIQWLPFYALALAGLLQRPTVKRVVVSAALLLVILFTSLYLALYAAVLTGLWLILLAVRHWHEPRTLLKPVLGLGAAALLVLLISGPILLVPMAREAGTSSYMLQSIAQSSGRSSGPLDIVLPGADHPIRRLLALPLPRSASAFVGLVPCVLAIGGLIGRRRLALPWFVLAGVAWLLSLGPAFPLYRLLFSLKPLQVSRYPDRFALLTLLGVAVMAALGVEVLTHRMRAGWRQASWLLLFGLVLIELSSGPRTIMYPFDDPFYHTLARDTDHFSVMELPIARINSPWLDMYAQTLHHHPIPNGTLARPVPRIPYEWLPLVQQLEQPALPDDIIVQHPEQRIAALRFFNLRYLIYHRDNGSEPVTPPDAAELARVSGVPVTAVYADDQVAGYQFAVPPGPAELAPLARVGDGWYDLEQLDTARYRWLRDSTGTVDLYAVTDQQVTLRLKVLAYHQARQMDVFLDEQQIASIEVQPWMPDVVLPPQVLRAGAHTLRFHVPEAGISPRSAGEGTDDRTLTVGVWSLEVEAQ